MIRYRAARCVTVSVDSPRIALYVAPGSSQRLRDDLGVISAQNEAQS
jgi:hypothetical protein